MKLVTSILLLLYTPLVLAEKFEIGNSGITFEAPDGFGPIPQEIVDMKWPSSNAPSFVVGNEGATTTIAYDLKPQDISNASLEDLRATLEATLSRVIPGIKWIQNRIVNRNGKDWVFLEMTSHAIDTDIHNIMMLTSFSNEMLVFNFNSTKGDFPKYEDELWESLESIRFPDE